MELSWAPSDRGELTLVQLTDGLTCRKIHEIRLDGELVASSEARQRERAHVRHALDSLNGNDWDVVVCGLGLGFAACAVLDDDRVRSLLVLESEQAIVDWFHTRLLPTARRIFADQRARVVCRDVLAAVASDRLDPHAAPGLRVDALLVNVAAFADEQEGRAVGWSHAGGSDLGRVLRPGGVLALWSDGVTSTNVNPAMGAIVQQVLIAPGDLAAFRGDTASLI